MADVTFRKKAIDVLSQIEADFDVSNITYKGFHVWPILRAEIGRRIENKVLDSRRKIAKYLDDTSTFRNELEDYFSSKLQKTPSKFTFIGEEEHWNDLANVPHNFIDYKDIQECDILFATRSVRNYLIKDGLFHSQEDYLLRILKQKYKCIKLEPWDKHSSYRMPRWEKTIHYRTPWENMESSFIKDFLGKRGNSNFEWDDQAKVVELIKLINSTDKDLANLFNITKVKKKLEFVYCCSLLCEKLLNKFKPKAIVGNLYTDGPTSGLLIAASRLKIPFIEIVNGAMGDYHWHYTHWTNLSPLGFEAFPNYVWAWDEESKQSIESTRQPNVKLHEAIVGGNCRFEYWKRFENSNVQKGNMFLNSNLDVLEKQPFVILVTHQYIDLIPDLILDTISKAPKDWVWLFRLHPQSIPLINIYTDTFKKYNLTNVFITEATNISIFDLLKVSEHLLTEFSTTAIEAIPFGIDITLTGNVGKEIFSGYIKSGRMQYAKNEEALLERLIASSKKDKKVKDFIIDDGPYQTLEKILNDWNIKKNDVSLLADRTNVAIDEEYDLIADMFYKKLSLEKQKELRKEGIMAELLSRSKKNQSFSRKILRKIFKVTN